MGRHEAPVESGPLFEFATDLRALRRAAGSPPYRRLERLARFSASTLADAASGKRLPTRDVTLAYVAACGGDKDAWAERWAQLAALLRATHPGLLAQEAIEPAAFGHHAPAHAEIDNSERTEEAATTGPSEPAAAARQPADAESAPHPPLLGELPPIEPLGRDDPRRVGPFHLVGRLGGGAMGEVYLAASPAGRPVAVKLIQPQLARDPLFRRRFARELIAARTVQGGHTPAVIDADADAERPWIATAYVPGPSLAQSVDRSGPLPEPVVLALAGGIAEALVAIHAAGIVHRDLKPGNILLDQDGPKVIDFGISRALDGSALTATGAVVGTAGYAAPELAARGEAGAAADVFSLGAVLAYAATGIAPFGEGRSSDVLYRVVHEPPDPRALACQDNNLRRLIEACLDKNPDRRPTPEQIIQTAADSSDNALPAALAAQIAGRGRDAAQLLARAQRARSVRRVRIGLAPLLLVLAIATVAALTLRNSPTHLDTAPPLPTASAILSAPASQSPATVPSPSPSPMPTVTATQEPTLTQSSAAGSSAAPNQHAGARKVSTRVTPMQLNPPDFNGYCQATGQGAVQLLANNAYGWHCSGDNGTGDDAEAVCEWSNGGTTQVTNRIGNFNDPNSWQCWAANGQLGPIDWNSYCQDKGWGQALDAGKNNAYTWYCTGSSAALDAQDACAVLYGSDPPISRFQNFYDKNSWQCWG